MSAHRDSPDDIHSAVENGNTVSAYFTISAGSPIPQSSTTTGEEKTEPQDVKEKEKIAPEVLAQLEKNLLSALDDINMNLPIDAVTLAGTASVSLTQEVPIRSVEDLLEKFAAQALIVFNTKGDKKMESQFIVESVDHKKLSAFCGNDGVESRKRDRDQDEDDDSGDKKTAKKEKTEDTVADLLLTHSSRERENKKCNEEILELLSRPTAKEKSIGEKFKSVGGVQVKEFCPCGTKEECMKASNRNTICDKLHFLKIIRKHTDESLGDCSFLNTCFHMDTCKYVHYEIDFSTVNTQPKITTISKKNVEGQTSLFPAQWVQCDMRNFDMSVLGKFAVVMADPPWDIHMELPYGTMSDDEMRRLNIPVLQDDGYIFLWVTVRAIELGRECLRLWGYERVDELIWVKTNQLQRIIRTGRTGHWLNHGKEHCLIGLKGNPKFMNRGLDCDVIVAEVRATSHKPDEIYGIIERLAPGTRKMELFGRPHNVQPNWMTVGNQLDGTKLLDPEVVKAFKKVYPDGNCMPRSSGPNG